MLIRMMVIGTHIAGVLVAAAVAAGSVFTAEADDHTTPSALVIDASLAREGRELVDGRLERVDAAVRLPRDADEARTNVRYFEELGYTVVVAGDDATGAAEESGEPAVYASSLAEAVAAAR
jgi:hypothetical protein